MSNFADVSCVICHDLFDDPVMCRDGFAYCRRCISKWLATFSDDEHWRSPKTNVQYEGKCIMVEDVERNCAALQKKKKQIEGGDSEQRLDLMATLQHCGVPVATRQDCQLVDMESPLFIEQDLHPYIYLEVGVRGDRLPLISSQMLIGILDEDRCNEEAPLLSFTCLEKLVTLALTRYDGYPTTARFQVLKKLYSHLTWRCGQVDSVAIPISRSSRACGIFYRAWDQHSPGTIRFTRRDGSMLEVPTEPQYHLSLHQGTVGTVFRAPDHQIHYTSETIGGVPRLSEYWRIRRTSSLPFPDYDGVDTYTRKVPSCCTIFEEPVQFVPYNFQYSSHGAPPHILHDAKGSMLDELTERISSGSIWNLQ